MSCKSSSRQFRAVQGRVLLSQRLQQLTELVNGLHNCFGYYRNGWSHKCCRNSNKVYTWSRYWCPMLIIFWMHNCFCYDGSFLQPVGCQAKWSSLLPGAARHAHRLNRAPAVFFFEAQARRKHSCCREFHFMTVAGMALCKEPFTSSSSWHDETTFIMRVTSILQWSGNRPTGITLSVLKVWKVNRR